MSALPLLYQRISLSWDSTPLTFILQLLRTVLQCPDIAFLYSMSPLCLHKRIWQNIPGKPRMSRMRHTGRGRYCIQIHRCCGSCTGSNQESKISWRWSPKVENAIKNGNAYALVTILLSQLHKLESLRLDYSFVWQSGFPGLVLKHALFSAPNGTKSKSSHLVIVDYGSNVPLSEADDDLYYPKGYPPVSRIQLLLKSNSSK